MLNKKLCNNNSGGLEEDAFRYTPPPQDIMYRHKKLFIKNIVF
jgi:hypothetical protein